jgi:glycosyltransferase involved in cell wall biosynthesis
MSPHSARHVNLLAGDGWDVHVFPTYESALHPEFSDKITVHGLPPPQRALVTNRVRSRIRLAAARTVSRALRFVDSATISSDLSVGAPAPLRRHVDRAVERSLLAFAAARTPSRHVWLRSPRSGLLKRSERAGLKRALGLLDDRRLPDGSSVPPIVESYLAERVDWLAAVIRTLKPELIDSPPVLQSGFLTLAAKARLGGGFPRWIVANWGADLHHFGIVPPYSEGIRAVLRNCDYYTCDCQRDVDLARELGFGGKVMGVLPVGGGLDVSALQQFREPGLPSSRRVILLKGYQNQVGRALIGLRAIELSAEALRAYRVVVYLADEAVTIAAEQMSQSTGISVEIFPYGPYENVMRLMGRARVSIGLSVSDGLPVSSLEAMTMGAFPIQSGTSCLGDDEWVVNGETGLIVPPEDPIAVAAAIRRAVTDDALVDRAAEINARVVASRADRSVVQPRLLQMYRRVAADISSGRSLRQ